MIALCLGGARSVWADLAAAEAILGDHPRIVVTCNYAGIDYPGRIDAWCSHHPDHLADWRSRRAGNTDYRVFAPPHDAPAPGVEIADVLWDGSSGLYAAQVALHQLGAAGAILCGVPMDAEAGHIFHPGSWGPPGPYRAGFREALPTIGGRTRAMGGWTASVFGKPTPEWVGAIDIRPAGTSAAPNARDDTMKHVKNGSATTLSFWHRQEDGLQGRVHLAPGESGNYEIDPLASEFAVKGVTITTSRAAAATALSATKKAAARKPATKKPAPPAEPASTEA